MDGRAGPDSFYLTRSQPNPALVRQNRAVCSEETKQFESGCTRYNFYDLHKTVKLPLTREIPTRIALEIIRKLA